MKRLLIVCFLLAAALLAACSKNGAQKEPVIIEMPTVEPAPPSPAPEATPENTARPESTPPLLSPSSEPSASPFETPLLNGGEGTIDVRDGDTLSRDIIPQLMKAFSLSEREVKDALAAAESSLMGEASGFLRMEGIIVPGTYALLGESIENWIQNRIGEAEQRYKSILAQVSEQNELEASDRVILASVVEGDTNLADSFEGVVATVYLNRIEENDKFGSCPTVEYALGYQRPYLTTEDTKIDSSYNTYAHRGLPPGPICCFDDESLRASVSEPVDGELYFFFYDYVKREILSFESYEDFKAAGKESKELFEATFDISRFEKMADKRAFFGN